MGRDVFAVLETYHGHLLKLLHELDDNRMSSLPRAKRVVSLLEKKLELERHWLLPRLSTRIDCRHVLRDWEESRRGIAQVIHEWMSLSPENACWEPLEEEFKARVRQYIESEQDLLFKKMRRVLSLDQLNELHRILRQSLAA